MKRLILRPRNLGYTNWLGWMHRSIFMSQVAGDEIGLLMFKAEYGLAGLPWWMLPKAPIMDPARLLEAGKEIMQTTMINGKEYAYGIDLGRGNSVEVRETWEGPTPQYPKGSYQMLIGGKVEVATGRFAVEGVKEPVPYWHGHPPFFMIDTSEWPKCFSPKPESEKP